jgi:peptidoglycan/LPS O-acetylase OafA/YrhL
VPLSPALSPPDTASRYLPTLDGWRAIAVSLVVFSHAGHAYARQQGAESWLDHVGTGTQGVNIFFGLSGLLITSRLLEEWAQHGRISLRRFYIRRAFRILPAALLVLAVIGVLGALGLLPVVPRELVAASLFFRNYLPALLAPDFAGFFTAHYWSLAVEEHFYLVWPALLLLCGLRRGLWAAVGVALGVAVWRRVELLDMIARLHTVDPLYFVRTDLRIDAIMWGAALALLLARPGARAWLEANLTPLVSLAVVALYLLVVRVFDGRPTIWESMLVPLMIGSTMLRPGSRVGRLLESPPMRWLGRLSYSLYLWELFFVFRGVPQTLGIAQRFPLNLVLTFACASASYYLVERPLIRVGHRLTRDAARPAPVPARERGTPNGGTLVAEPA